MVVLKLTGEQANLLYDLLIELMYPNFSKTVLTDNMRREVDEILTQLDDNYQYTK